MHNDSWWDGEERKRKRRVAVLGALTFLALLALAIFLPGCAGGSSSGNYHKTFRPPSHVDSAE